MAAGLRTAKPGTASTSRSYPDAPRARRSPEAAPAAAPTDSATGSDQRGFARAAILVRSSRSAVIAAVISFSVPRWVVYTSIWRWAFHRSSVLHAGQLF